MLCKLYKGLKQKSPLPLPPDQDSVTPADKKVNLRNKIWFKPKYDVHWQVHYGVSLVYWDSTVTDCNETKS